MNQSTVVRMIRQLTNLMMSSNHWMSISVHENQRPSTKLRRFESGDHRLRSKMQAKCLLERVEQCWQSVIPAHREKKIIVFAKYLREWPWTTYDQKHNEEHTPESGFRNFERVPSIFSGSGFGIVACRLTYFSYFDETSSPILLHVQVKPFRLDLQALRGQFLFCLVAWLACYGIT